MKKIETMIREIAEEGNNKLFSAWQQLENQRYEISFRDSIIVVLWMMVMMFLFMAYLMTK